MTLTPDESKKSTSAEIYATTHERKALAKLIKEVRERLIFDKDGTRTKGNVRAIQAAPDETGATQPLLYVKLDNFLKKFTDAIENEATSVELGFEPNEFSKETGDKSTNDLYTNTLKKVLKGISSQLVSGKDVGTEGLWADSNFAVKGVFDLAQMEGITSGEDLSVTLKKGKIIPEYGGASIPPSDRYFGLKGSKKKRANRGFLVIVEDMTEEGLTQDLATPLKIRNYSDLVKRKSEVGKSLGSSVLNAYREDGKLKPKNKLDLLSMAMSISVGISENVMSPRPILSPKIMKLNDPDMGNKPRRYFAFTISGYTGARGMSMRTGTEAVLKGVQTMPEVGD